MPYCLICHTCNQRRSRFRISELTEAEIEEKPFVAEIVIFADDTGILVGGETVYNTLDKGARLAEGFR